MEITTQSGAEVKINAADFLVSMQLKSAIIRALRESDLDLAQIDLDNLTKSSIEPIVQAILSIDSNEQVEASLFKCLARCTYDGEKISKDTFEPVERRGDYYEIVIACLKENLLPFFQPLLSKFTALQAQVMPQKSQEPK